MSLKYQALIIDDSKPIAFFNKLILNRSDLFSKVKISENGQDAFELLNTDFSPDIIFLDINMPVMDGWEFLDKYTISKNKLCPVLLLLAAELSDKDKSRLKKYSIVKGVRVKMLSAEIVSQIKNTIL